MLRLFGSVMLLGLLSLGWAAKPASTSRKSVKKSGSAKTTAKRSSKSRTAKSSSAKSGARSTGRRTTASRAPVRKPVAAWRTRQIVPTPERYKQIQEALAAKGYLPPEDATGVWNSDSVDALRRFQADQKIEGGGKINSLSIIALGLGPKRESLATSKPQAPPQPPPPGQ